MAVVRYTGFDLTVNNILDRNAISPKVDNMVVTVLDAIGDPEAGGGVATYRWSLATNAFILVSKSTVMTMSFDTLELVIDSNGEVILPNIPTSNQIWNIIILDSAGTAIAFPKIEDLTVTALKVSGLTDYVGDTLRFSYAYGAVTQQILNYIDSTLGTVSIFEGAIV